MNLRFELIPNKRAVAADCGADREWEPLQEFKSRSLIRRGEITDKQRRRDTKSFEREQKQ